MNVYFYYSWKEFYQQDLKNYEEHGDTGEVWFGLLTQRSIIKQSCLWHSQKTGHSTSKPCDCTVLEIGTGNGQLLHNLYKIHPFHHFTGLDYVKEAIEIASKTNQENNDKFTWKVEDFLSISFCTENKYYMIFDKGTFDAITLGASSEEELEELVRRYRKSLLSVSKPSYSLFIIASCNWTFEELDRWFSEGIPHNC